MRLPLGSTLVDSNHSFAFFPQSTYCRLMAAHFEVMKRPVKVINLDPAAEHFDYPVSIGAWANLRVLVHGGLVVTGAGHTQIFGT